jgi:Bacterial Ig-like domain (group 2)
VLFTNSTLPLNAQGYDKDWQPVTDTFTWKSGNPSVAEVDAATGVITAESVGTSTVSAVSSRNISTTDAVTVANPTFWSGSYQITACNIPGSISGDVVCNEAMAWPNGGGQSGQISFRTGSNEKYNFRRDFQVGGSITAPVCKADSINLGQGTSTFTESTFVDDAYNTIGLFGANKVTYTITSQTAQSITGTFTAPVPYQIANTGSQSDWVTGSLQGTWQATTLSSPFPKCVPPSDSVLYCVGQEVGQFDGVEVTPPDGAEVQCAQPFESLDSPYREGEWAGLP